MGDFFQRSNASSKFGSVDFGRVSFFNLVDQHIVRLFFLQSFSVGTGNFANELGEQVALARVVLCRDVNFIAVFVL